MSDYDPDKAAKDDEDIFLEANARLEIASAAESQNRINGLEAINFSELGQQWDTDTQNQRKIDNRPALTINHTQTFCRRLENKLRQQRPRINCHPVGDGATIETAATVNGLIRHIEAMSLASVAYDTGAKSALNIGWGYWRIVSDYIDYKSFDQELMIKPIRNTFTVYMDPSSVFPDGRDQKWCIISETIKRQEYKRQYPNATNADWQADAPGDMSLGWENKEEIRLAEYFRIYEVNDTLIQMNDGSVRLKSELPEATLMAVTGYMPMVKDGKQVSRKTTRCEVQWFRLNGKQVVEKRVIPGRYIPVIRCEGNVTDANGKVVRSGMVATMMDPARMYNYWRTQQTERYALAPKAPWVVAEGQTEGHPEWNMANQKAYSMLVYKPIAGPDGMTLLPPPQRQNPAQVEAGMAEAAAGAEHDLMSVAGMPQENPEIAARVVGGNKYLQRRQGMEDLTHYQYYDNQTMAIAWTGSLLLEQIPYYYDTKRMQRIIGEDGRPEVTMINDKSEVEPGVFKVKNDLTVGRYDVVMDTGPGYATKREEGAAEMTELLGTPLGEVIVKTGSDIVLRNFDFPGAQELADRAVITNPEGLKKTVEGLPKQAQTIVAAMQQEMQAKDQQIQQLSQELKFKTGIEQMKDDGQTKRTVIQTLAKSQEVKASTDANKQNSLLDFEGWMAEIAEWRNQAEVNRQTKLDVAEIQVAGSLLNTHAEAAHEQKAADKAIKAGENIRGE